MIDQTKNQSAYSSEHFNQWCKAPSDPFAEKLQLHPNRVGEPDPSVRYPKVSLGDATVLRTKARANAKGEGAFVTLALMRRDKVLSEQTFNAPPGEGVILDLPIPAGVKRADLVIRVTAKPAPRSFASSGVHFSPLSLEKVHKQVCILIARKRSGTHVLEGCLGSHPGFRTYGEIFFLGPKRGLNMGRDLSEAIRNGKDELVGAYHAFHKRRSLQERNRLITTEETFLEFVGQMKSCCPADNIILDIKYNSVNVVQGEWPELRRLRLFELIQENNWKVIQLTRKNYLEAIVSQALAQKRERWIIRKGDDESALIKHIYIRLNPDEVLNTMQRFHEEDAYVASFFEGYPDYLACDYGDMFDADGRFTTAFLEVQSRFFGVENRFDREPTYVKTNPRPLSEVIGNYSSLARKLKKTRFRYCVED